MENNKAIILLEDGTSFIGRSIGKKGTTVGEICFNTGLTGYQEIFTDPSYYGQIVTMTASHIGNYGAHEMEVESDSVKISGLICKDFSVNYSRDGAHVSLQNYLEQSSVVGIDGIDTRELVRHIRDKGAMNVIISSDTDDLNSLKKKLDEAPSMHGLELSSKVSTKKPYVIGNYNSEIKIAAIDFGIKTNIINCLANLGVLVKVFPMNTSLEEMIEFEATGFFLSNGPGDPSVMTGSIDLIKDILKLDKPIFGICLGHQLLSLALGLTTYKMHNGHRGLNHPVKNVITGKCEVTSQNHGFAVDPKSVSNNKDVEVTHINLNDDTIEGIRLKSKKVFSVQHHPEASPGPHDSRYLFEDFINNLKNTK